MQIKQTVKLLTVAILFTLTLACKKDNPSNQRAILVGSWTESPLQAQYDRTFYFAEDGSFTLHSNYFGSSPSGVTLNGTYSVNGNQLTINVTEEISKSKDFPSTNTKVNYSLLDKATFSVSGNKLTLNYTSYPADAPVATTMVLIKN